MEIHCRLTALGSVPVLHVSGEIDLATLPVFRDHLTRAIEQHPGERVWVDLDGVTALDDTGLGMLLAAAGRARERAGDLGIVCTTERLCQRLALTGLDRAVEVRPRVDAPPG